MTTYTNPHVYQDLLKWAQQAAEHHKSTALVDGAAYGQPGQNIFTKTIIPIETGGQVEVNLTQPIANEAFEWLVEITIDDTEQSSYKHYLLRKVGDIVETYGKQVTPVDDNDAFKLYTELQKLSKISS